jgi:hypothetical protein
VEFLAHARRAGEVPYAFEGQPAVKDAVEALGVPHPEVEAIVVNGVPVDFSYLLHDGDRVDVYPAGSAPPLAQ